MKRAVVVLLLLVVILIVAAVAGRDKILWTIGRSRQIETMGNMRTLATTVEAYATDHKKYPTSRSVDELSRVLQPTYIKDPPRRDAWRRELRYELIELGDGSQVYFVASPGRDGQWQRPHLTEYVRAGTTSFDADIIFSNGQFVQYPAGPQTQ